MSKLVQDTPRPPVVGTITQFLTTLPSPLTVALISLAPQIRFVRWVLELVSWKGNWNESWLLLAGWWGLCLGAEAAVRYTLPVLAVVGWWWIARRTTVSQPQLATEESLHQTIANLTTIRELLPHIPSRKPRNPPSSAAPQGQEAAAAPHMLSLYTLLRVLACAYPPYLLLTTTAFVRLRTVVALAGTLVLVHRAPWAALVRRALWRSAYVRWGAYWVWAKVSGQPLAGPATPPPASDVRVSVAAATGGAGTTAAAAGAPVRFLFTVCENQRWWMGLDWTAALLPGERPSWCSRALLPCSPPAAFGLPPPSTVYVPPSAQGSAKAGGKHVAKRTATWGWEEPEWKVVVRKEGATANTRVERPLPSLVEEGASASAGKLLRAAGKIRGASVDLSPERRGSPLDGGKDAGKDIKDSSNEEDEEPCTDPDGWVYGDNKWEGGSAKGGMGKYTRFRRWSRIAVLTETVEWVDESDIPPEIKSGSRMSGLPPLSLQESSRYQSESSLPLARSPDTPLSSPLARKSTGTLESVGTTAGGHVRAASVDRASSPPVVDEGSRLRQRLKAVVSGVGH
ncbi:hypothetical protein PHLGIDRAFT_29638 [Phlebiopsis gigantea 11061_1 CR5-6]|uniref:TECPR1-like DysF domain-containing protein n=1 Tax=Phlebiopsis gigantea (strain 11061_1 CR5-6) TaxID=745531 RepID=A0A0C3S9H9_PHLG1|nr:hypothetical protein PHLGIDRAFT_29638 [Phlebiopsis gigantea 11061_1 CR5-6]